MRRDRAKLIWGGSDGIWRAFPQAVLNFRVEVVGEVLAEVKHRHHPDW